MVELNLNYSDTACTAVVYREYDEPEVNMTEMFRYSGIPMEEARRLSALWTQKENSGEGISKDGGEGEFPEREDDRVLTEKAQKVMDLTKGMFCYRVGYLSACLYWDDEGYPVLPINQKSDNLKKNLRNCEAYVMFAATIGSGIDRLIRRYEVSDPSMGVLLQGFGAERAESLCNLFCEEVKQAAAKQGFTTHPRFSPGFGDLPITVQKEFLDRLDATRRMGITLGESFLMSPSKSVTAIIGLERE